MIFSFFPDTCLFKGIAPHDIKTLMDYFDSEEQEYKKGDIIFKAGTSTPKIGIIEKGTANVVVNHPWGTSSVFGQLKDGDVFGGAYDTISASRLVCDTVAAENCKVMFFDMNKMLTITDSSPKDHIVVMRNLVQIASETCLGLAERMIHTAPNSLRHRIMSYLADLAMKNGSNKFKVPFGRQQMADYLNVNRVAMCGELSKMQKDGLIKFHKFDFEIFFGNRRPRT
ncbi:MAG: Crp/Fnr family transcriptional regulator [Abditibacteriota bacterium]|nr:Crp/Fnr family transcriptional regulator [Abditibacteriota bacterium]